MTRSDRYIVKRIIDMAIVEESSDAEWVGKLITHLNFPSDWTHHHAGLAVCDLVRHIARAFKVDEEDIWEWVEKERRHPTTDIQSAH